MRTLDSFVTTRSLVLWCVVGALAAAPEPAGAQRIPAPFAGRDSTFAPISRTALPIGVSFSSEIGAFSDENTPGTKWLTRLSLGPQGPVHAEVMMRALRQLDSSEPSRLRADARIMLGPPSGGAWLGVGQEPDAGESEDHGGVVLGLGGWAVRDQFTISASLEQAHVVRTLWAARGAPPDTGDVPTQPLESSTTSAPATAAQLSLRWNGRPVSIEAVGGVTAGVRTAPYRWGQAILSLPLSRQFALFATAGSSAPRWFALDPGGGRRAALGLRFTDAIGPVAQALDRAHGTRSPRIRWRLEDRGAGVRRLEIDAKGARLVEVMGDMTSWSPVALERLASDRWTIDLELAPGVHEINLRLDGGPWLPPPGAPTRQDGFNGEVGLIVVE